MDGDKLYGQCEKKSFYFWQEAFEHWNEIIPQPPQNKKTQKKPSSPQE
jgi:hypothetical protein